jgi:hypothetical protein
MERPSHEPRHDELQKDSIRIDPSPAAEPLAETLVPWSAVSLRTIQPILFFVRALEEKRWLVEHWKLLDAHVWTLAEVTSLLGANVSLADVARVFGNDTSSFNEESGSNNE